MENGTCWKVYATIRHNTAQTYERNAVLCYIKAQYGIIFGTNWKVSTFRHNDGTNWKVYGRMRVLVVCINKEVISNSIGINCKIYYCQNLLF